MTMARHQQMISSLADPNGKDLEQALLDLESSDPEQAAMIKLFLGDSVLLRQQYEMRIGRHTGPSRGSGSAGSAIRYYEEAWALFTKAGFSSEQLNGHFACPVLLPLSQFDTKLAFESSDGTASCTISADNIVVMQDAAIVRDGVPGLRYENMSDLGLMTAAVGVNARLDFAIGMNGQAERIKIRASQPESTASRIRGKHALESLQFRPALHDARPVKTNEVTISLYSLEPGK
jgi:hypothetical protein